MAVDVATEPTFLSRPEFVLTNGDVAAEVGELMGLVPDVNQRMLLDGLYAEAKPGYLAAFEAGVCAPRQNIKSSTLEIAAVTDVLVFREPLHVWTAHLTKTMRGAFEDMRNRIENCDYLRKKFKKPREANGQECLELLTGERIEFYSRSKGGGRGRTARKVTLDEALILDRAAVGALLPTLVTQINAQVRYGSSAGLATSEVWRSVRDRGRLGAPRLFYAEWAADRRPCEDDKCPHSLGYPGCTLDDEALWGQSNPALGDRITLEALRDMRRGMPPEEFAREFLGWWDDPAAGSAITLDEWTACTDMAGQIVGQVVLSVDMALDRTRTTIGICGGRPDERRQVEVIAYRPGTTWVKDALITAARQWSAPVALDASGPAGALVPELEQAGLEVIAMPRSEVVAACGNLVDAVKERRLAHLGDDALAQAVVAAQLRSGEQFVFTRKGDVDICPLYAVTLALWGWTLRHASGDILQTVW